MEDEPTYLKRDCIHCGYTLVADFYRDEFVGSTEGAHSFGLPNTPITLGAMLQTIEAMTGVTIATQECSEDVLGRLLTTGSVNGADIAEVIRQLQYKTRENTRYSVVEVEEIRYEIVCE